MTQNTTEHKCPHCNFTTSRKYNVTRHVKNMHKEQINETAVNTSTDTKPVLTSTSTLSEEPTQQEPKSPRPELQPSEHAKNWFMPYLSCIGKYHHNDIIVAVYEDLEKRQHTFTQEVPTTDTRLEHNLATLTFVIKYVEEKHENHPRLELAHNIFIVIGALLLSTPCLIRKSVDAYKECLEISSYALRILGFRSPNHGEAEEADACASCTDLGCKECDPSYVTDS